MKLSVWSSYYIELSPEDAILELAKHGIHYTELSDEHAAILIKRGNPTEVGKAFGEFARANGVEILQGHLWLRVVLCTDVEETVKTLCDWLDLFDSMGIRSAVLHCDRMRSTPDIAPELRVEENVKVLKLLAQHIEGRNISICLENLTAPGLCSNADEILTIIKKVGSNNLGICLDTGHLNLCEDRDQVKFIKTAGKYLKALHIADNDKSTDQHLMPFGKGNVDFFGVVKALKEIEYGGLFNYEIPGENHCPLEVKGYKLDYIRNTFNHLISNAE